MTACTLSANHSEKSSRKPCSVIQRLQDNTEFNALLIQGQGREVVTQFRHQESAFINDACKRILRNPLLDGEKLLRQACNALQRKIDCGKIRAVDHFVKSFLVSLSRNARRDRIRLEKRTLGTMACSRDPQASRVPGLVVSLDSVKPPIDHQHPSPPHEVMLHELREAFSWEAIESLGLSAQVAWAWGYFQSTKGYRYGVLRYLAEIVILDGDGVVIGLQPPMAAQRNPTQATRPVLDQVREHIARGCGPLRQRATELGWGFDE